MRYCRIPGNFFEFGKENILNYFNAKHGFSKIKYALSQPNGQLGAQLY